MMNTLITRIRSLALLGSMALVFSGCADTTIKKAYTAPGITSLKFNKVFVIGISPDDMNRRMAEVAVKDQITKIPAVGSYELLPDVKDIMNKAKVIKAVKDSGADGVIALRLVSKDQSVTFSSASPMSMGYEYYYSDSSNIDTSTPFYQNSATLYTNRVFGIESSIYDARTAKLLWRGDTQTIKSAVNVGDVPSLITEVAKTVRAKLQSDDLIK